MRGLKLTTQSQVDAFGPCSYWDGSITIEGPKIDNLATFRGLTFIEGTLKILDTELENLNPLSDLNVTGTITIRNSLLENLSGLGEMEIVYGKLMLENNSNLVDLTGFGKAGTEVRNGLTITNSPALFSLSGADHIAFLNNIAIQNAPQLVNISELNFSPLRKIRIYNNSNLESISGLRTYSGTSIIEFINNPKLDDINIDIEETTSDIIITNCGIENVDFLDKVFRLKKLNLNGNVSLKNIDGLINIDQIENEFGLIDNENLEDCCGAVPLLSNSNQPILFTIYGNPSDCNSASDIINACDNIISDCESSSEQPWQEWISNVQFGNIDNTSGKCHNGSCGYSDFSNITTTVEKGATYELSASTSFSYFHHEISIAAYIDFNQDGFFDTNAERVLLDNFANGLDGGPAQIAVDQVVIPQTAELGTTKMRIIMQTGQTVPDPCTDFVYGEVEDYSISIVQNSPLLSLRRPIPEVEVFPNPVMDKLFIQLDLVEKTNVELKLTNQFGQILQSQLIEDVNNEIVSMDVAQIPTGVYFLTIDEGTGKPKTTKIVKQQL